MSTTKKPRGLACLTPEQRREIASKGGKAAHATGRAHQFDSAEAADAGRKGGMSVSQNREHMAKIGAAGGSRTKGERRRPVSHCLDCGALPGQDHRNNCPVTL